MKPIKKEILLHAPAVQVWAHLTDPAKIATWFAPCDFAPTPGHRFHVDGKGGCQIDCIVQEVVVPRTLVYTFRPSDIDLDTFVTFTLEASGASTKLTLVHSGWEKLPPDQAASSTKYDQGWGTLLHQLQLQARAQ